MATAKYAEVAVPLAVYDTFTYSVPEAIATAVVPGSRVEVPFGGKLTTGYVIATPVEVAIDPSKVRPIRAVLDEDEPALTPEIIDLCRWAATYYIAPLGETIRMALPANMSSRGKRMIKITAGEDALAEAFATGRMGEEEREILAELRKRDLPLSVLGERAPAAGAALRRLRDAGLVTVEEAFRDARGVRYDRFVILVQPDAELSGKQKLVVELLTERRGTMAIRSLVTAGASESAIGTLARKGVLRIEKRPRRHTLDAFLAELDPADVGEIKHSAQQKAAVSAVAERLGTFAPFLLQGVTGSGKTEVYIELMRKAVKRGEQAILLVPEISLTPVFAARLKERFGDRIAILHSSLSSSERYDQWWRARRGEVDVAIGPRSALFTPFQRLGLIVVDEEGDGAYKQEETPRYNARDLAVVRAQQAGVPVVLGSATPSLESRENADRGKYQLLRLTQRVEERPLPKVEIVDIRREKGEKEDRGLIIFSERLKGEMRRVFEAGEQAVILMNRRGYAPFLLCRECEEDFRCRDCSVTLTVHRRAGRLVCHYCGYQRPIPPRCPICDGEVLQPIGFGTEKVEERFRRYFPDTKVEVLDRDSTRRKGALLSILGRFRRGETQALIGTQMISKGHHFPSVTLTGVINADAILGYPDFRSAEKTFYLITQVAGRAGRGETPGQVMIQTAFPNHYAIQHAAAHDSEAFYRSEIEFRRTFHYPPVTGMVALLFRGNELSNVERAATRAGETLGRESLGMAGVRMQGPAPAPLARLKGVYRYQILLRSPHRSALRELVVRTIAREAWKGVDVSIDVDPINVL
jgi:primosomal protein N' (replication factor Y) (superfamily II helicase)